MKRKAADDDIDSEPPVFITMLDEDAQTLCCEGSLTHADIKLIAHLVGSGPSDREHAVAQDDEVADVLRQIYSYRQDDIRTSGYYERPHCLGAGFTRARLEDMPLVPTYHIIWYGFE